MGTKKSNKLYAAAAALAVTASAVAPGLTADAASKVTVKSVTNPASISHYGGYTFAVKKLSLPKTVKVLLSNKKYENRSVKWGKVSYDAKYIGKYQTISGTVSGTTKKASIKVKLNNYPVDVVEPMLAPVAVGEKLNLPSTIKVKYKNGSVVARSAKSFNLTAEKTDKAGMMKLSYNYMGNNSSIKGSIAYEVKDAEITNVMDSVKEDTLSVSADVKFPAKDAKAQLLIFPGKDESKALPAIDGKLEGGKFTAEGKMIPDGTHSYSIKIGDVVTPAKEFKVDNAIKLENVSAFTAKSLKVKFNKSIDTAKAAFEVKKGSVKVNTSGNITWNEDKTVATIELSGKLTAGEYTVNVSGLSKDTLAGKVAVQDEKVAKIEILSTEAPLFDATSGDADTDVDDLQVGYRVLNQYGEDITRTTSLTTSSSNVTVNPTTGTVTITGDYNTTTNKLATFTLIHAQTATTATATVTAVSESKVSEVTVKGLYNKDGKKLTETTNLTSDQFYVELELKDQYGKVITDSAKLNQVLITESNSNVVNAASSASIVDVDGVKKVLVSLTGTPTVGENVITAIATATGKSSSYKVEVSESTRAYGVDVVAPELTVAKEQVLIPVNVTDKEGNLITDLDLLKNVTRGIKVTVGGSDRTSALIVKEGKVYLPQTFNSTGYESVVVISNANQKVDTLTLEVKESARPVIITGLVDGFNKAIRTTTGSLNLTPKDLVVEDQYGRIMDSADFADSLGTSEGDYQVLVNEAEEANTSAISIADNSKLSAPNGSVSINASANKGSEKVTIQLAKVKANSVVDSIAGTEFDFTVETTDAASFKSYEFATIGKMYDEVGSVTPANDSTDAKYDKDVVVYGVLDSGKKIELDASEYSVKAPAYLGYTSGADKFVLNTSNTLAVPYAENASEYTAKVDVVINATGDKLTQNIILSKAAPKVTEFKLVDQTASQAATSLDTQGKLSAATAASNTITLANTSTDFDINDLDVYRSIVAKDSYGVYTLVQNIDVQNDGKADFGIVNFAGATEELAAADLINNDTASAGNPAGTNLSSLKAISNVELTIKPVKDAGTKFAIENNGTKYAALTAGLDAGDEFDVVVNIDGVEKTLRVKK